MLLARMWAGARDPDPSGRTPSGVLGQALREEGGQGVVEYALIILLIAIALITAVTGYQVSLSGAYAWITENIAAVGS